MGVQSMSPESVSAWCESLAHCRINGQLLRALKEAIVRRGIDGKQFGEMLRENTLQNLGIEDLNPRLCVAIRKAWHTDFAQMTFVPYHPAAAPRGPPSGEAFSAPPTAGPAHADAASQGSLGDMLKARGRAPTSYAAPAPHAGRPRYERFPDQDGGSLGDVLAPRPKASSTYAAPAPAPWQGPGSPSAEQQGNGRATPSRGQLSSGGRQAREAGWDGRSRGDLFGPPQVAAGRPSRKIDEPEGGGGSSRAPWAGPFAGYEAPQAEGPPAGRSSRHPDAQRAGPPWGASPERLSYAEPPPGGRYDRGPDPYDSAPGHAPWPGPYGGPGAAESPAGGRYGWAPEAQDPRQGHAQWTGQYPGPGPGPGPEPPASRYGRPPEAYDEGPGPAYWAGPYGGPGPGPEPPGGGRYGRPPDVQDAGPGHAQWAGPYGGGPGGPGPAHGGRYGRPPDLDDGQ
eukprot:CAMPEP_0168393676 /NCGR_PEP_ID=MMETSP0228-20121227/19141_1 /TAXON_ID=133427 /ORGANISM="Protoceratium reticulatum, Strain CCCM 535 (=CCMP 1889)" /LENGTH=452 /DNA_ID=CAMNT_0008407065 /DNA_START=36 /DNA_END=1391 /DNA_ORIENTATION=+